MEEKNDYEIIVEIDTSTCKTNVLFMCDKLESCLSFLSQLFSEKYSEKDKYEILYSTRRYVVKELTPGNVYGFYKDVRYIYEIRPYNEN